MLNVCIFMVVCTCICVLLCVCKCMYVCFLGQGRTAMPTGLSLNYKSNIHCSCSMFAQYHQHDCIPLDPPIVFGCQHVYI